MSAHHFESLNVLFYHTKASLLYFQCLSRIKHLLESVLTHEVFKHGLLMSQQVVNNGFPTTENTEQASSRN